MNIVTRLNAYVDAARARRFRYGRHDCALFAAGWLRELGHDDLSEIAGPYASLREGIEALQAAGYDDHLEVCARHMAEVPVARAQVGDVAAVGDALGIVAGEVVFVLQRDGLAQVPLTAAGRVFRCPR